MVFGVLLGTGLFYLLFADGKEQKWNNPKRKSSQNDSELSHEALQSGTK